MRKSLGGVVLAAVLVGIGFLGSPKESGAAQHFMRVYGVMGGAFGDANIQYVELRQATGGQNFVSGHHICFFDAAGAPYARFQFPANVGNGASGASILVGTSEFDSSWAAGSPDFTLSGANTVQIAALADVLHPVRQPAGKVSFGFDSATMPAAMCQSGFVSIWDSVAYGTGYSGSVNFGTAFNTDLPTAGTSAVRLTSALCNPCARDNSTNYGLLDVNITANNPRNNSGQSGPLAFADADGDGVADASDLCPSTAPAAPVDANGCSQAQVDQDLDGICTPGAPSAGPSPGCTGSDNCPDWENPLQESPEWTTPAGDTDCDGYHATTFFAPRAGEADIGTVPTQHCNATPTIGDEPLANDAWPPDFNDNQLMNGADILHYNAALSHPTTDPPVVVGTTSIPLTRFDLNNSEIVTGADILQLNPFFTKRCKPLP